MQCPGEVVVYAGTAERQHQTSACTAVSLHSHDGGADEHAAA